MRTTCIEKHRGRRARRARGDERESWERREREREKLGKGERGKMRQEGERGRWASHTTVPTCTTTPTYTPTPTYTTIPIYTTRPTWTTTQYMILYQHMRLQNLILTTQSGHISGSKQLDRQNNICEHVSKKVPPSKQVIIYELSWIVKGVGCVSRGIIWPRCPSRISFKGNEAWVYPFEGSNEKRRFQRIICIVAASLMRCCNSPPVFSKSPAARYFSL